MNKKKQMLTGFDSVGNALQKLKAMYEADQLEQIAVGFDTVVTALQKLKAMHFAEETVAESKPKSALPFDQYKLMNFDILKKIILNTNKWPQATSPVNIADLNNVEEMTASAENLLDMFVGEDLHGKNVLEYYPWAGGYISEVAKARGAANAFLIGATTARAGVQLIDNIEKTKADVIISFDVLEYEGKFKQKLAVLAKNMKPKSKFYLRCHHYFSRHATRLYRKHNFAYLHLLFTETELKSIFADYDTFKVHHYGLEENIIGEKAYDDAIASAGFKILDKNVSLEPLDSFFVLDSILQRVRTTVPEIASKSDDELKDLMELQFIDYCLTV